MSLVQYALSQYPLITLSSLFIAAMKFSSHISCALLLGTAVSQSANTILDLSMVKWTLSSPQNTSIQVPANIPSQAHLDLYAAGVIPDPYFGLGDFELRWVTYSNWTYSADLSGL